MNRYEWAVHKLWWLQNQMDKIMNKKPVNYKGKGHFSCQCILFQYCKSYKAVIGEQHQMEGEKITTLQPWRNHVNRKYSTLLCKHGWVKMLNSSRYHINIHNKLEASIDIQDCFDPDVSAVVKTSHRRLFSLLYRALAPWNKV